MKKLYIVVSILFFASVLLFISAFIYLDKEKRMTHYYIVNLDGHDVGMIKIDKFVTEDKLIYKSVSNIPFHPMLPDSKSRITLDRRYNLESYTKENSNGRVSEAVYFEKKENNVSFVATSQSEFACLSKIPIRGGTFVFDGDSPATYLPIIENYDFRKGRSQGFNAITHFSTFLPPMKRFVTLTSVRDEYVKIDSKKIKTECLLLKMRNYPQGSVWVSKSDRSLVMLEIPDKHLKIVRIFSPKSFEAKDYIVKSDEYVSKDVAFKNKNVQLAGTLTVPKNEGAYPAVLLIWGPGPQDRRYQGLFVSIASYLSKNGYCVFRFDKRGIGSSEGDFSSTTDNDEIEDIGAALEYLGTQKEIDPKKIVLIGHSKGAIYALDLASRKENVKAIILMAPLIRLATEADEESSDLKAMASKFKWGDDYLKLAMKSRLETLDKVKGTRKGWASILGKRCFLARMRDRLDAKPLDTIKTIKIPVLILQGKEDQSVSIDCASTLDKALEEAGNVNHALIYFGYVGHLFGKRVNDGEHKIHYEADGEVLHTIKNWLDKNLVEELGQKIV